MLVTSQNVGRQFVLNFEQKNIGNESIIFFGSFSFNPHQLRLKKGEEFIHLTESEAKILNEQAKVVLRCNALKITKADLQKKLLLK